MRECAMLETLTAQEARVRFGDLLLKSQRGPVQITRSGKPISVIMSAEDYEIVEAMKMSYLKEKLARSKDDVEKGRVVDGPVFFDDLLSGKYDNA
jgi:prevent-host-death family protein